MEVLGPKGPHLPAADHLVEWARDQLLIASDIVDNPGGGLLFATQTLGQVRSALLEAGGEKGMEAARLLAEAEDAAIRRRFARARELMSEASHKL